MPNETEDYNNAVRAALPSGMTFSGDRYRYNNHSFSPYKLAAWYYYYILRTGGGVPSFSPSSLFAASEQGVWYDPSDLTTLFQDSAGTTPVTAAGQTVALMLDKSKGLALGSELVTNGDFANPVTTGWTSLFSTLSVVDGRIRATGTNSSQDAAMSFSMSGLVVGRSYRFSAFISPGTRGVIRMEPSTGFSGTSISRTVDATISMVIVATSTTGLISFRTEFACPVGQYIEADNISVKELPGFHATQATTASRPTYGINPITGTRNLLTYTEQFDNAAWAKTNATVTANAAVAPDGKTTAYKLIENSGVTRGRTSYGVATAVGNTISVYAKAAEWNRVSVGISNGGGLWGLATFNLSTGLVDGKTTYGGVSVDTPVITPVGNGWYRCSVRVAAGSDTPIIMPFNQSGDPVNPSPSLTGDGTSGILIWGAQLELGSTATAYQRVTDQYNVTEAGVASAHYLRFDGTDDSMSTNTITPGIDKAQVFTGVRKLSDTAVGIVVELSADVNVAVGSFLLAAPGSGLNNINGRVKGTLESGEFGATVSSPNTRVVTLTADIAGSSGKLRLNASDAAAFLGSLGTGNFLAYPLYIGRRGGTSLPFNGHIYSLIVRFGANLTTDTITSTETYVNGKTGVTL